jgi:hypothetical protein
MGSNASGMASGNNIRNLMHALQAMQAGVPPEDAFAPPRPPAVELPPGMFGPPVPGQPIQVAPAPEQQPQPPLKSVLRR